ncbi:hypothetical protein D3C72_1021220 [compost metagenome]
MSSALFTGSLVPGTSGTPCSIAMRRAASLEPISAIAEALGPTQVMPRSTVPAAKASFSAKKP